MTAKKATPKKPLTKSEKPAYTLLLKFDAKEVKQLDVAHKITGEATATKAIIKCLYLADYYLKEYEKEKLRAEKLQSSLLKSGEVIQDVKNSLKNLNAFTPEKGSGVW